MIVKRIAVHMWYLLCYAVQSLFVGRYLQNRPTQWTWIRIFIIHRDRRYEYMEVDILPPYVFNGWCIRTN